MKQNDYTLTCSHRLMQQGYTNVDVRTDQAITAIDSDGCLVCFLCFPARWSRVGELEVEELIPLMRFYSAERGAIQTTGGFTRGAKLRAREEGNITLYPRFCIRQKQQNGFEDVL